MHDAGHDVEDYVKCVSKPFDIVRFSNLKTLHPESPWCTAGTCRTFLIRKNCAAGTPRVHRRNLQDDSDS